jgi:hypothetical protein
VVWLLLAWLEAVRSLGTTQYALQGCLTTRSNGLEEATVPGGSFHIGHRPRVYSRPNIARDITKVGNEDVNWIELAQGSFTDSEGYQGFTKAKTFFTKEY